MITHLEIENFRNLSRLQIHPNPTINILYGNNGSGKTSLLEAIHCLALGRSFRTRQINRIISYQQEKFQIVAQIARDSNNIIPVGLERNSQGDFTLRIAGKNTRSLVQVTQLLPVQLINQASHRLITSGGLLRRQFLDWGVFHMEPQFFVCWQRCQKILKQRNAALSTSRSIHDVKLWDAELTSLASQLHSFREKYLAAFLPALEPLLKHLLGNFVLQLHYYPGWAEDQPLPEVLVRNYSRDLKLGYTQFGPHRADLQIKINDLPVQDILSQGQQKLLTYSLKLAQAFLMSQQTHKQCLFLIDDLPAELDKIKQQLVAEILMQTKSQVFITGINSADFQCYLQSSTPHLFHVEHGKISQISNSSF